MMASKYQPAAYHWKQRYLIRIISCCLLLTAQFLCTACELKRPVMYPNNYLKQAGQAKADQDIDICFQMAVNYNAGVDKTMEIAKNTGKAAVVGGVTGTLMGAINGDAGTGAALGAAGGATGALGAGLMSSDEPDPIFKQFVEQCLRERGYQPIGWK